MKSLCKGCGANLSIYGSTTVMGGTECKLCGVGDFVEPKKTPVMDSRPGVFKSDQDLDMVEYTGTWDSDKQF